MNKHFLTLLLFLSGGLSVLQAQERADSLLLAQMVSSPNLIAGKTYVLETGTRYTWRHTESRLIKESDTPEFYLSGELKNGLPYSEFGDKPIVYNGASAGKIKAGDKTLDSHILSFTCCGVNYRAYTFSASPSRSTYNLIEVDFLNRANELLAGKTLYTRTALWYDDHTNDGGRPDPRPLNEGAFKYHPVTVTRVINEADDRYIVFFKPHGRDGEYSFVDIVLTGSGADLFRYFSSENPRDRYPGVPDGHWERIMAQKVKQGFTPDEVRIAYGERPDEVFTVNDDETWVYYNLNGKDYAITFRDGVVKNFVSGSDLNMLLILGE